MPGRKCKICHHKKRSDIESSLRRGISFRNIKQQFGLKDHSTLSRHTSNCLKLNLSTTLLLDQQQKVVDWVLALSEQYLTNLRNTEELRASLKGVKNLKEKLTVYREINNTLNNNNSVIDKGLKTIGAYSPDLQKDYNIHRKAAQMAQVALTIMNEVEGLGAEEAVEAIRDRYIETGRKSQLAA